MEACNITATNLGISQFALSSIVQLHDFIESVAEAKEVIQDVASTLEGVQRPLATLEKLTISDPAIYAAAKGYLENIGVVEAVNSCGQACARLTDNMKQWTKHSGSENQLSLRDRFSVGALNREIRTFRMEVQSCYAMVNFAVTSMKLIVQLRSEQLTEEGREQKTRLQDLENKIQEHINLTKKQQDEARRRRRELQEEAEEEDGDRHRALSTPDAEGQARLLESEQASTGVIFSQVRSTRPGQDITNIMTSDDSTALQPQEGTTFASIGEERPPSPLNHRAGAFVDATATDTAGVHASDGSTLPSTVQESDHGVAPFHSQPLQEMNSPNAATQELSTPEIDSIFARSRSHIGQDEQTQYTLREGDDGHVDLTTSFIGAYKINNGGTHEGSEASDTPLDQPPFMDSSPHTQVPFGQFPESQRFKTPATAGKKRDYLGNTKETPDLPRPGLRFGADTPAHVLGLSQVFGATQAQTSPMTDNVAQPLLDPPSPTVNIELRPNVATSPDMRPIAEPDARYVSMTQSQAERARRTSSNILDDESDDDSSDDDGPLQSRRRTQQPLDQSTKSPRPTRLSRLSTGVGRPNSPSELPPSQREDDPSEAETEQDDEDDNDGLGLEHPDVGIDMENKENDERMITQIPETVIRSQRATQDVPVSPSESPSFRAGGIPNERSSPAVVNSQPSQPVRRAQPKLKSSGNSEIDCVPQSQADHPIQLHNNIQMRSDDEVSDAHPPQRQFSAPPCLVPESSSSKQPETGSGLPGYKSILRASRVDLFETPTSPADQGLDIPHQIPSQGHVSMTETPHEGTELPHTPIARPRSLLRRLNRSTTTSSRANMWDHQVSPEKPATPQQDPVRSSLDGKSSRMFYISGVVDSKKAKASQARSKRAADGSEAMARQASSASSTTPSRPSTPTLPSSPPTAVTPSHRTKASTTDNTAAPDMVFACFNGKTRAYYPARCLEKVDNEGDIVRYRVQWDGADPDEVDAYGIKAIDLHIGDQVKVDMKGFAKAPYVVRGFKHEVDHSEIGTVMTDIRGFRTVLGLFATMVFAISYDDPTMKHDIVSAIKENGGSIVRDSFMELLQSDTIAPKPEYQSTGFTALLADGFSRKEKYMQALALGLPCLSGRWILDSVEGDSVMDWQTYLLPAGESAALDGAVRSRILPNLHHRRVEEARLEDMLQSRPQPLANMTVAAVIGRGKAEARRKPYLFLIRALGAASVSKFPDLKAAKAHIAQTENETDWLFVDDRDVDAARAELTSGKKTKAKSKPHTASSSGCKVAGNELIVQSVILVDG
ncbi:hypothetical protein DV738_g3254, partial [Chaetothyriales sp. CBS 135597]